MGFLGNDTTPEEAREMNQQAEREGKAPPFEESEEDFAARKGREHVAERQRQIIEEEKLKNEEKRKLREGEIAAFSTGLQRASADFPGRRQTILTSRPSASGKASMLTGLS